MCVYADTFALITHFFANKMRKIQFANMTDPSIHMKTLHREWLCWKMNGKPAVPDLTESIAQQPGPHRSHVSECSSRAAGGIDFYKPGSLRRLNKKPLLQKNLKLLSDAIF